MPDQYLTQIRAECAFIGEMKTFAGPNVPGISFADAEEYCKRNGMWYCKVVGRLVADIPCKDGSYEPDYEKMVDYEIVKYN